MLWNKYIGVEITNLGACSMARAPSRRALRQLHTLFRSGAIGQQSDEELLERFVASRGEDAEAAFAALVERHGAMVLGVCQCVLRNRHAAEDAFQATFLVLARKAAGVAHKEQLASWLFGVARRVALDARARSSRLVAREKRLNGMLPAEPPDCAFKSELRAVLDEELARLPERHRSAIILCELEGLSRRQAAVRLGVSEGTLSSRLARGKARLREQLTRRGVALSATAVAGIFARDARAVSVPPALFDSTIRCATLIAGGSSLAGVVSTSVATLTEGVLKAMLLSKLKIVGLGLITLVLVTGGVGVVAQDHPSSEDRLKALERKIDRLIEVLGGFNRSASTARVPATGGPITTAAPAAAPAGPALAGARPTPALVPPVPVALVPRPLVAPEPPALQELSPGTQPPAPPVPAATPFPPSAAPLPAGGANLTALPIVPQPVPTVTGADADRLDRRVRALEDRLTDLERRFADFQQRVLESRQKQTGSSGSPGEASGAGHDLPPASSLDVLIKPAVLTVPALPADIVLPALAPADSTAPSTLEPEG
jgi:RNA polymerase sigma factor (sigma-70 family)